MNLLIKDGRLAREVLFFGLPLVLGLAAHAMFNLVDTLLVGALGDIEGAQAISVTGLCDPITTFQTIIFNGPIAGAGVLLARRAGARDEEGLREVALRSASFVMLISLVMAVPGVFWAEEIARAMGAQPGWQIDECEEYLRIMIGAGFTAGMFLYLTTVERALGRTMVFLLFFMLSNVLNLMLGLFLIYGDGPLPALVPPFVGHVSEALGIPRMGVIGSAWSTVGARGVAGLMVLGLGLWKGHMRGKPKWLIPSGKIVIELMRIGIWNNGQVAARGLAGGVMIRSLQEAGEGDPSILGGIFVGLKIELLLILLSFGWGAAAQTLVATSLGSGKIERAAHQERLAIVYATLLGIGLTVPGVVFAPQVVMLFNPEPGLVDWAVTYVRTMVVAFIFTPINIVISQAMVAHGRLKTPVIVDSIVLLGLMTPIMIIGTLAGAKPQYLIIVNAVTVITLTVIYVVIRWKQGTRGDAALMRREQVTEKPQAA